MKRMLFLTILFFISLFNVSNAQQQINIMNAFNHYKLKASNDYSKLAFLVRNSTEKKIVGTTAEVAWKEAILLINQEEIYSVKARYRAFDDELQILLNDQPKAVYPHLIKGIAFEEKSMVSGAEKKEDGPMYYFYELMVDGQIELLCKEFVSYKTVGENTVELGKRKTDFYFRKQGKYVEKLNTSPKKLLSIFGGQQEAVKAFIKKHKLSTQSEADLKRIFQFYNQL